MPAYATFVAPEPNCGHGGATFTHHVLGDVWLCPLCWSSIALLAPRCQRCGQPRRAENLVDVFRHGSLCYPCRRGVFAGRRALLG